MDRWEPLLRGDIGKMAMMVTLLSDGREEKELVQAVRRRGYLIVTGKVGSMDPQKVVGSIESSVKRQALIDSDLYREEHALYHAMMEALLGISGGRFRSAAYCAP